MGSIVRRMAALLQPAEEYTLASRCFLKLLAVVYFSAFFSLTGQITGLAGANGILPFAEFLDQAAQYGGVGAWLHVPSIFWLDSSDTALQGATLLGCLCSLTLFLGRWPRISLLLLFLLYLSLCKAGQRRPVLGRAHGPQHLLRGPTTPPLRFLVCSPVA